MKFFIFFLVFGFVIVSSSADEITETTGADFITTTEVTVPENDVFNDEIPVDSINLLRQSDNDAANESSTVHFTELACTKDNMEWLSCGPRCYQTCGFQPRDAKQRKSRAVCVSSNESGCYTGCFCKSGYVRLNDKCVLPTMCPIRPCLVNEEYKLCGSPCQLNCDNYGQKSLIEQQCPTDLCVRGCFCRPGYVRAISGLCVLPVRCPRPFVS